MLKPLLYFVSFIVAFTLHSRLANAVPPATSETSIGCWGHESEPLVTSSSTTECEVSSTYTFDQDPCDLGIQSIHQQGTELLGFIGSFLIGNTTYPVSRSSSTDARVSLSQAAAKPFRLSMHSYPSTPALSAVPNITTHIDYIPSLDAARPMLKITSSAQGSQWLCKNNGEELRNIHVLQRELVGTTTHTLTGERYYQTFDFTSPVSGALAAIINTLNTYCRRGAPGLAFKQPAP